MFTHAQSVFQHQLQEIETRGLWKSERIITSPQNAHITVADGATVLNLGGAVTTLTTPDRFQHDRAFCFYFILE